MTMIKRHRALLLLLGLLLLVALACGGNDGPPANAAVVNVTANTSLAAWLEEAAAEFNDSDTETAGGDPVYVQLTTTDAGQAVVDLAGGDTADLWIPDAEVWASLLAEQGNDAFLNDCASVAESPLVIAMWRPVAEALGWPGRELGWLDIGSLAADPTAWDYYSGGEFGDTLRLGHTHPGLSGSGSSTLLALVQAAESKTDAVTTADIEQPIVQASVSAFESAVSWFSNSTGALAATMQERGPGFLGAAVMYESDVVAYGDAQPGIIAVYPFEGTFVATHPACIRQTAGAETTEAATLFRDYLLSEEGQQLALAQGLRPVNAAVSLAAPLDASHGVDPQKPAVVFNQPSVATVFAVQELWQAARKDLNLVMVLDVSGSMGGSKIENMRRAAEQFVEQMGDDDYLTLMVFSTEPQILLEHARVGEQREQALSIIRGLEAFGDTALYDAVADAAGVIGRTTSPETSNAIVVLTDGLDTSSFRHDFDQELVDLAAANSTTIFTIAYGDDADEDLLEELALAANGNFFLGTEASIAAIYEEMSAAFGGSVGVGR